MMTKRRALFRHFHHNYPKHIIVIQESHSSPRDSVYWQAEWGAPIMFAHGPNTSECGVAVLIPRCLLSVCKVTVRYSCDAGRLLIIDFEYDMFKLTLCAVYAPTQNQKQLQISFLENLREQIDLMPMDQGSQLILCGDFNLHLSELDVQNCRFRVTQAASKLKCMLDDSNLVDVWRERYKSRRRYTWRRLNPLQQSRIDYVFASSSMISNHVLNRIEIRPGVQSDHSLVIFELKMFGSDKGRGLYRFDNRLLEDPTFVQTTRHEIMRASAERGVYANAPDLGLRLEMLTSEIRVLSIKLATHKARERREGYTKLANDLDKCEIELGENPTPAVLAKHSELRASLDQIEEEKGKLAMIRSGARWLEQGEKPTKYFLKLNARRDQEKHIAVLQKSNGEYVTDNKDILNYCRDHYEGIYATQGQGVNGAQVVNFVQPSVCPQLNQMDKSSCEGDISDQECEKALRAMMNNKSPSVSGFSKEFFLFFWKELGDMVVTYINQARENGTFFVTQRRGVLTLLPKKGDQKLIKNKRAICLLDIIYKIVAKVLANRMMAVMSKIVASDQTGSMRGRYIGTNLRTIADVIHYCGADRLEGLLMALDFRNAFNTVEYGFVYEALKMFNFGESFISWIRLLHHGSELTVINNGFTSSWFRPSRGLQQGCPASAPLFALVVEILAIKFRARTDIQGIKVGGTVFKLTQYCDDTTLFVKGVTDAEKAAQLVSDFGDISGLELNMDKCEFMWLGQKKGCDQNICGSSPTDRTKILGVWFSAMHNCNRNNFDAVERKIKGTLDQWTQRDLTIKGRITVAKSLVVSQIIYLMAATRIDEKMLATIQSHIMKFVWRGRPPKVAKDTMTMLVENGGLKLPNVQIMNKSSRIAWVGRMLQLTDNPFVQVLQQKIRLPLNTIVRTDFDERWIASRPIPEFYKEMLVWFKGVQPMVSPTTGKTIRMQSIWHNNVIRVQNRTLASRQMMEQEVVLIDDITDNEGALLTHEALLESYPTARVNPLVYMGWCRAIPRQWRQTLVGSAPLTVDERREEAGIVIQGKEVALSNIKSSYFYIKQIPDNIPNAQRRWEAEGIDFGNDWRSIYEMSFKVTTSTRLQSLQHRIIHRYFPNRKFLYTRQVINDPFCDNCGEVDTLQHYVLWCADLHSFWRELAGTVNVKMTAATTVEFNCRNILFGCSSYTNVINLIVLVAKQFIVTQHMNDVTPNVQAFRPALLKMFNMEKCIAYKNMEMVSLRTRWEPFIADGNVLDF